MSNKVTKRLTKKDILTIPNALSLLRILMVGVILWSWFGAGNPVLTVCLILFSALTDIVDGWIARHFDMISDLGKFIDPVADKLTQAAMIICLIATGRWQLIALLVFFGAKEIVMFIVGSVFLRKADKVNSAQWHGKLATTAIYVVMVSLMVFPQISEWAANVLLLSCFGIMAMSFVLYLIGYAKGFKSVKREQTH